MVGSTLTMSEYEKAPTKTDEESAPEETFQGQKMKDVMLQLFGILSAASLIVLLVAFIVAVVVTNENIKVRSQNELESQIERQAHAILSEGGDFLIGFLNNYDQSVASTVAQMSADTLRRDGYSMSMDEPSYFDYEHMLAEPLSTDSRQVLNVSFSHSSYYVTGATPADITSFSDEIKDTRNATAHVDDYYRYVYDVKDSLVGAYTAFDTVPEPFIRSYPGSVIDDTRTYDPTVRDWYVDAIAHYNAEGVSGGGSISLPYIDAFGKGFLITSTRVITERPVIGYADTGTILGVSGSDIVVSDIQAVLDSIQFLDTGKLTLFTTGGIVVSDAEWNPDLTTTSIFTYADLTNPAVSADQWASIEGVAAGTTETIKSNGYHLFVKHLSEYGAQYYLVVFVKTSEILAPSDEIVEDMETNNAVISVTLAVVFAVLFIVVLGVILHLVNGILASFTETERNVDQLLANVGHTERNIAEGMVDIKNANSIELQNMQHGMHAMIATLQRARGDRANADAAENAGFNNMTALQNLVPVTDSKTNLPNVSYVFPDQDKPGGV